MPTVIFKRKKEILIVVENYYKVYRLPIHGLQEGLHGTKI